MKKQSLRRAQATAETRQLILEAAKALYLEKGYRQAPSRELARRAGVAEGTIFAHFADKASLLAAALHDDLEQIIGAACTTLPSQDPCRDRLLHLARALYDYYALRPELSRALVKESLFLEGEWGERVTGAVFQFIALISNLVEEAKAQGEYKPDVDATLFGRTFFAAYYAELLAELSSPHFESSRALANLEAHIRLWEGGILQSQPCEEQK